MGNVIGIDLGTTNTAVSVLKDGRPRMLEDSHGYKVVPSIVWIGDGGVVKVGQQCKALLVTDPTRTAFAVKRILGRHFSSQEVDDAHARVGYNIREDDDGGCLVELRSETLTPVQVSAHVLRTAKEMAENSLDGPVQEAVITVPAYFNHAQRSATLEAAKLAGLHCERLLNEPTAAALAYGFRKEIDRTLLVFDLGGGTFDVSVLKLSKGVYEILSTLGDSYLGGEDFDHRIVDWVAERFEQAHGVDLRQDRIKLHRLKEAAEKAKCELSFTETVSIQIPHIHEGLSVDERLDRETLIALVQDYIDRALEVSLNAVSDAGLGSGDVDEVILVGGQTRMPAIREAITAAFGQEPSRSVHPEEVVAMGAAVHAASLTAESDVPPAVLIDVTPFDLGIDVASGMFQPIIARNSAIPTAASRIFATAKANQASVQITVRQGSSRMASDNEFLGEFIMSGLTPAPRMETKVEVNFQIDTNGMLRVSAVEPATGKQAEITVRNFGEVAGSKGAVSPDVHRAPGTFAPDEDSGEGTNDRAETDLGKSAKKTKPKKVKKKAKKEKKSAEGGGLLGALFGRMSKTRTKRSTPAAADKEGASIIDQVVAEREAAQAEPSIPDANEAAPSSESPMTAEPIQLPDIDPSALEALEPDMDEPAPIQLPELGSDDLDPIEDLDDLDDLGADALEELGDLGVDDLEALDDLDGPAVAALDSAPVGSTPVEAAFMPSDELDDLVAEDAAGLAESEEERMERQRAEMMDRLSQPIEDDLVDEPTDPNVDEGSVDSTAFESEPSADTPVSEAAPIQSDPEPPPPEPAPSPPESIPPASKRKTARLKLSYKNPSSVVREYTENLQRGGCFIKTPKPLAVGREVLIEVRVPSIADNPISIPGVVTWSSRDLDDLEPGQDPGMGIEYLLDNVAKAEIADRLATLT